MLNQFILVGYIVSVDKIANTMIYIDNGEHTIPVVAPKEFYKNEYLDIGNVIACKGKAEFINGEIRIVLDKVSLIATQGDNYESC